MYRNSLEALEYRLLDSAESGAVNTREIENLLINFLEGIISRKRQAPLHKNRERVDVRGTVHQYLRQGKILAAPVYHRQDRQKKLILLLDCSESFYPYRFWNATIAMLAQRIAPEISIYGYHNHLEPIDPYCTDIPAFIHYLESQKNTPAKSMIDLPEFLEQIVQEQISTHYLEVWITSDLLLSPNQQIDFSDVSLARFIRAISPFLKIRIFNPMPATYLEQYTFILQNPSSMFPPSRVIRMNGTDFKNYCKRMDFSNHDRVVFSETGKSFHLNPQIIEYLSKHYPDTIIFEVYSCSEWLQFLSNQPNIRPKLEIIQRKPGFSSLYELFIRGVSA